MTPLSSGSSKEKAGSDPGVYVAGSLETAKAYGRPLSVSTDDLYGMIARGHEGAAAEFRKQPKAFKPGEGEVQPE